MFVFLPVHDIFTIVFQYHISVDLCHLACLLSDAQFSQRERNGWPIRLERSVLCMPRCTSVCKERYFLLLKISFEIAGILPLQELRAFVLTEIDIRKRKEKKQSNQTGNIFFYPPEAL